MRILSWTVALSWLAYSVSGTSIPLDGSFTTHVADKPVATHRHGQNQTVAAWNSKLGLVGFVNSDRERTLALLYEENKWKNSLVVWILPESWRESMPHWAQVNKTNIIMGLLFRTRYFFISKSLAD